MLRARQIVGLAGHGRHSRQLLHSMGHWQRALAARVRLMILREPARAVDGASVASWAADAQLDVEEEDVTTCCAMRWPLAWMSCCVSTSTCSSSPRLKSNPGWPTRFRWLRYGQA